MVHRDRRLRVLTPGDDGRAECLVVHDDGGTTGCKPFIKIDTLASLSRFELAQEADDVTSGLRYARLLATTTAVDRPGRLRPRSLRRTRPGCRRPRGDHAAGPVQQQLD
jgi:hypothetical protein